MADQPTTVKTLKIERSNIEMYIHELGQMAFLLHHVDQGYHKEIKGVAQTLQGLQETLMGSLEAKQ